MLHLTVPAINDAERRYVLDIVLRRWLGLDHVVTVDPEARVTTIRLADRPEELTVSEGVLSVELDRSQHLAVESSDGWADLGAPAASAAPMVDRVPVLHGAVPSSASRRTTSGAAVDVDVWGTVFALLTGLEDRFINERDGHGRVPATSSLLHRRGMVERPVVDELVEVLWAVMSSLWPRLTRRRRQPKVSLTQDVDRLTRFGEATMVDLALAAGARLRIGGPAQALTAVRQGLAVRANGLESDPYYTFERFMDLSEKHGHVAGFYFIARFGTADGTRLGHYEMDDPLTMKLLRRIVERGHNLGVHPGYDSHLDVGALRADAAALEAAASAAGMELESVGGRHHYLRWDSHRSPGCWAGAGLSHDSSVGFAESIGFRAGTSKPFPLWDHQQRQPTNVEERPLIYMDATLPAMGMTLRADETAERLLALKASCLRFDGDFTLLVHNEDVAAPGGFELLDVLLA